MTLPTALSAIVDRRSAQKCRCHRGNDRCGGQSQSQTPHRACGTKPDAVPCPTDAALPECREALEPLLARRQDFPNEPRGAPVFERAR
jgi:hypothetical protein